MWSAEQFAAAQQAVDELRQRASMAWSAAYTEAQLGAAKQVLAWCQRIQDGVLGGVMTPGFANYTYEDFIDGLKWQHWQLQQLDGDTRQFSALEMLGRFTKEVVAQSAVDLGQAAKKGAEVAASGATAAVASLPWLALGLLALAAMYVTKAVR